MRLPSALSLLSVGISFLFYSFALAQTAPNLLALIKSQPDYKFITVLIERDPVLVDLYTNVKGVTCILVTDSGFPTNDPNAPGFNDIGLIRAVFQYVLLDGNYPASAFTATPKYVPTRLTNESWINTSYGKGIVKIFSEGGKKTARSYSGRVSHITKAVSPVPSVPNAPLQ